MARHRTTHVEEGSAIRGSRPEQARPAALQPMTVPPTTASEPRMRVLVLGAAGMLGSDLRAVAPPDVSVIGLDVNDLDITNRRQVASALDVTRPEWVINAAAYTAVD